MNIRKILKTHQEFVLGAVGVALGVMLTAIFFWGIADLTLYLGKAVSPKPAEGPGANFDLEGAKRLDLKGLAQ